MDKVYFSIIVPIYNVEKYLKKCVDSVLCQSFSSFELILVDDGSPDMCGSMCDEIANVDERICVVHKPNGGLSSARNSGIDIAKGKYVIFLDSDDYWDDSDALKNIHTNLLETNADVLVFPAKRYYETENKTTYILKSDIDRKKIISLDPLVSIKYMIEENVYRAAAWNKVVKKEIIDLHHMRFKDGYLSEDMDWCGDLLLYSSRFDFYSTPLYVYRQQRAGSITREKSEKLVSDKLFMCRKGYEQIKSLSNDKAELLASYYAYEYSVMLGVSSGIKNKNLLYEMRNLKVLLDYKISKKVKKVNMLKKCVGYELTRKILCLFVKMKR